MVAGEEVRVALVDAPVRGSDPVQKRQHLSLLTSAPTIKLRILRLSVPLLSVLLAGCVSKSKADAQARAAFIAGQQQALMRMQQAQNQGPSVTLHGQVRNPVLPWSNGLTLAQAIVDADYYGPDPSEILIVRAGRAMAYDPKNLLSGSDIPLQPGDLVEIRSGPYKSQAITPRN